MLITKQNSMLFPGLTVGLRPFLVLGMPEATSSLLMWDCYLPGLALMSLFIKERISIIMKFIPVLKHAFTFVH